MSKQKEKDFQKLMDACTFSAEEFSDHDRKVISLGPNFDYLFNGGILEGSFIILTGPWKTGKTAAAIHMIKKCQEEGYKGVYFDAEHRIKKRDLMHNGLDKDRLKIIKSSPGNILTAEKIMKGVQHILQTEENVVVVVDSVSQMCPDELWEGDIADRFRDTTPGLLARFSKIAAPVLSISNNILIVITHEIANTSGKGYKTTVEASGTKIQYAHDFKLRATHSQPWKSSDDEEIGKDVNWVCVTSGLGPPNRKGVGKFLYNEGIIEEAELYHIAKEAQCPEISTSWLRIGDWKANGENQAVKMLKEHPEALKQLQESVNKRLKFLPVVEDDEEEN